MKPLHSQLNRWLLSGLALTYIFAPAARAQETEAATTSALASIKLPASTTRVRSGSVPKEVTDALTAMMQSAGTKVKQGRSEVLAWTGDTYKLSRVPQIKAQVSKNLKAAGWQYEEGQIDAKTGAFTLVSVLRMVPTRKALIGFWAPTDDALLLAWTEMLPTTPPTTETKPAEEPAQADDATPIDDAPAADEPTTTDEPAAPDQVKSDQVDATNNAVAPVAASQPVAGATVLEVGANQMSVNVMKNAMPKLPTFPKLAVKPGMVRGYVKDSKGNPLAGAVIGARSTAAGGFYSGAQGKSDAKGYYEIAVPWGAASFYCAGYTVDYGEGRAALGLHPADGEASQFATANGLVENWVQLPYGIAERDEASENPQYAGNYYGGSVSISYSINDDRPVFANDRDLPDNSQIELTLAPTGPLMDGSKGRTFVVRRRVQSGSAALFYINNIPNGSYRISGRLIDGGQASSLRLRETGPYANQPFGLEPKESTNGATLSFRPGGARAASAIAQRGNWSSINITVSR